MYTQEKKRHTGIAHASSNMQDRRVVYWYAFTTKKLPSTSHAASMKSREGKRGGVTGVRECLWDILLWAYISTRP